MLMVEDYNQNMSSSLSRALRTTTSSSIAFTGAGGKTTAMFQLAREFSKQWPVILTASSHLGMWQVPLADKHMIAESPETLKNLQPDLQGIILITSPINKDRTKPLNEETL